MLFSYAGKLRLAANKLVCYVANIACGGGTCCGGEWHSAEEEGECCNNTWYVGDESCPGDQVYRRWGEADECCGCLPSELFDTRVNDFVAIDDLLGVLCCQCLPSVGVPLEQSLLPFDANGDDRGCYVSCCKDGVCTDERRDDCLDDGGTIVDSICCAAAGGCQIDCCYEDSDGNVQCSSTSQAYCVAPKVPADPDCETGCLGQCCIDGEPQGMVTQAACADLGGQWQGLGVEECGECACRDPFSCDCCESKTSTAAGLVFTQPRNKRQPPWTGTFRVVATGRTESAILIHGEAVGPNCDFEIEFVLCWESFNVEPVPCGTNFKKLDIKVCWFEEPTITESLNFSGCNTGLSIHLGDCQDDCVTTLVYDQGDSRVSDAHIYTRADAELHVENGTIEFTGNITAVAATQDGEPCANSPRVLTLTGGVGKISGVIEDLAGDDAVEVRVDGGEWWLSGANEFSGRLKLLAGTLVIADDVAASGASPVGVASGNSVLPLIAGTLLLDDGVTFSRGLTIDDAAGVVLGGRAGGTSEFASSGNIQFSATTPVTLQAGGGEAVTFANSWTEHGSAIDLIPAESLTFGSSGNAGTVIINNSVDAEEFLVAFGTAKLGGSEVFYDATRPFTVDDATLDLNGYSQTLADLTFSGNGGEITGGTLNLGSGGTAAVTATGTGHAISSAVDLDANAAFTVNSSSALQISGVVSGAYAMTLTGGGTLTLSAANTYTGTTTINGGTAVAGNAAAFGTGNIVVNAGGTLNTNGYTLANTIINNGGTVI